MFPSHISVKHCSERTELISLQDGLKAFKTLLSQWRIGVSPMF